MLFLISNGDIGGFTTVIITDNKNDLPRLVNEFARQTRTPLADVVVNPVGDPITDHV